MSDTATHETSGRDTIASISHTIEECRAQIDELLVQLDLAKLNAREDIDHKLEAAQNAYLAAHSKLAVARADAGASVDALRQGVEQLLHDIGQAYAAVDAAIRRATTST